MNTHIGKVGGILTLTAFIGLLGACEADPTGLGKGPFKELAPQALIVTPDHLVLAVGQTFTLEARLARDSGPGWNEDLSWATTDQEVLHVSALGEITAVGLGDAFIVAETGDGLSADAWILVVEDPGQIPRNLEFFNR